MVNLKVTWSYFQALDLKVVLLWFISMFQSSFPFLSILSFALVHPFILHIDSFSFLPLFVMDANPCNYLAFGSIRCLYDSLQIYYESLTSSSKKSKALSILLLWFFTMLNFEVNHSHSWCSCILVSSMALDNMYHIKVVR